MKRTFIVCLLFSTVILSNGKPTLIDKDIMNLALNYEFDKADKLLAEQINESENIKNHFIFLNVELIKVIKATDETNYKTRRAVKDSLNKILIDYAEKIVEKYEDEELSTYDRFYLGSIHGVLGRLYGVSKSMTSAFSSGKEGRNIMQEIIDEDPNFIDAYLLPGMLNYYADRLGGLTEFFAGILGLSGDRKVGLDYLEKVELSGEFNNWQAAMILIELYSRMEGNKFASLPLLKKITERFPNNSHFLRWYCFDLISLHRMDELETLILQKGSKISDFIKASYYHEKGDFEKSNEIYSQILTKNDAAFPWIIDISKYGKAINYYMLGELTRAENLKNELRERDKFVVENYYTNGILTKEYFNLKKAVSFNLEYNLESIPDTLSNNKYSESFLNYYKGVQKFKNMEFEKAVPYFLKAKDLNSDDYGYNSIRYLIHIFKSINVAEDVVEKLMEEIDDLDNDGLDFFAQDLEFKYNL